MSDWIERPLSDEEYLAMVSEERRQSVGFEHDSVLLQAREQALNYAQGLMKDLPSLPTRSQAVSMDIADAVETAMPDLVEIFLGGDDVVTFVANSKEDEKQAQQETDYIKNVIFNQNDGFLTFYSMFKDALLVKTGVVKFDWEKRDLPDEKFEAKSLQDMLTAMQDGEIIKAKVNGQKIDVPAIKAQMEQGVPIEQLAQMLPPDALQPDASFDFTVTKEQPEGRPKLWSVPPEDFTVALDTVRLADTTYCAFRSRPRAYMLKEMGIAGDVVDELPPYGTSTDETTTLARDTAGEHLERQNVVGHYDLRQVEVIEHFIRVDADGEGVKLHRVLSGGNDTILLDREVVDAIPFAAITPYMVPHRFYGESLADKLVMIQQIRTALLRMLLDSGYFGLNQRMYVDETKANENTIPDLLANEPGRPIRGKGAEAVTPVQSPGVSFDTLAALEFMAVQSEQRTGIVRNAQGLNPDTLHDTAQGAMALIGAAQKRLRLIARVFAETGLKDVFLGVHALIRKHAQQKAVVKLRGEWVDLDPTQWAEREQMTIEIGLGSAGKMQEVATLSNLLQIQQTIVEQQQGLNGPLITGENVYNALHKLLEKSGEKNPDEFVANPSQQPPQQPQPNPEAMKLQVEAQKHQGQQQVETAKVQQSAQVAQQQAELDFAKFQAEQQNQAQQLQLAREKLDRDDKFRYAQLAETTRLSELKIQADSIKAVTIQSMKDANDAEQRQSDLVIQASEARDAERMADDDD